MSNQGVFQRKIGAQQTTAAAAPMAAASVPHARQAPGARARATSFADLERAARKGHSLDEIATHASPSPERGVAGRPGGAVGLAPRLKAGLQQFSGLSMDDVRVHHDSTKPAAVGALAYTQGAEIHLAPGQAAHLTHEAWHAVQQRQGRVKPTLRAMGALINDSPALEAEADRIGRALDDGGAALEQGGQPGRPVTTADTPARPAAARAASSVDVPVQRKVIHDEGDTNGEQKGGGGFYDDADPSARRYEAAFEAEAAARRRSELGAMRNSYNVAGRKLELRRTRFDAAPGTDPTALPHIARAYSGMSGSPSHDGVMRSLGDDMLGRMFRNTRRVGELNNLRKAFNNTPPLHQQMPLLQRPDRVRGAENARLQVGVNRAASPHYDPSNNSISLMNPHQLDQTAHETQHAHDHVHGTLDLDVPEHRLASELNAFTQQQQASVELTGQPPQNFEGRSPQDMAKSYHRKRSYPGTLASSLHAVAEWKREH